MTRMTRAQHANESLLRTLLTVRTISTLVTDPLGPALVRCATQDIPRYFLASRKGRPWPICSEDLTIHPSPEHAFAAQYGVPVEAIRRPGEPARVDVSRETSSPDH